MNPPKVILGLDVSKAKLDAWLRLPQPRTCTVPNTPAGHAQLLAWAAPAGPLHLCLEATSTYGFPVARHAHAAGHTVSVLQPLAVHRYAQATLARNKTDRLDAALLADFGHTQQPRPWTPPPPAQATLQAQSRLRTELVQQQQGWTNHLATAEAVVRPVLRQVIRSLQSQIAKLDRQLAATLRADPALHRQAQLLHHPRRRPRALRRPAGRAARRPAGRPRRHRQSGTSVRGRTTLSKVGNARLRRLLYLPALAGRQHNPVLRAHNARLLANGKPGKVRVGAVMRKLLCLCVGVLRSGQPWNPTGRPTPKTAAQKSSP